MKNGILFIANGHLAKISGKAHVVLVVPDAMPLSYSSLLRHSMGSTEMPLSIFSLEFTVKPKTSFNNSALHAAQVFGLKR